MAKDNDIKHVIVLDEGKKTKPEEDEASVLLEELDRYAPEDEESGDDREERAAEVADEVPVSVKPGRKLKRKSGLFVFLLVSLLILTVIIFIAVERSDIGYREPVAIYEKYLNEPDYNGEELSYAYANGLARRQFKELRDIQHKSQEYLEGLEASGDIYRGQYLENIARYGEGMKWTVTVDRAEELSDSQLLALTDDFRGLVFDLSSSSMARADDKELAEAVGGLTYKLSDSHITKGYHLYCTKTCTGQLDDGPVSTMEKCEFTVVRLNGHWIMWDKIYDVFRMTF